MDSQPLVSIVTPMYNSEEYIEQTINSVLNQQYENWELIIVDDGSTDDSWNIIKRIADKDQRIKIFKRDRSPKGVSTSRNIGIECSKGEYIIFLDSDDMLYPHCLKNRVSYLRNNPELDFAVFQMEMFLPNGDIKEEYTTLDVDNYLLSFLTYKNAWGVTCPIWQSSFFKSELVGFDQNFSILEDPELHTRALMLEGVRFEVLPQKEYADCAYRVDYKPRNIKGEINAAYVYAKLFLDRIKGRKDEEDCRIAFVEYYETLLAHYSGQGDNIIYQNIDSFRLINNIFRNKGVITRKMFYKTKCFLKLHQYRLFNKRIVTWFLKKMNYTNFYYYIFK